MSALGGLLPIATLASEGPFMADSTMSSRWNLYITCNRFVDSTGTSTPVTACSRNRRLLEPIGDIPPAEFEQAYYDELGRQAVAA